MKKVLFLSMSLLLGLSLASCANNSNGSNLPGTVEQDEDFRYNIYLEAKKAGYEGTYDEWLATIKGEPGLSAYEIYKKYHKNYNKTEKEWIDDLVNGRLSDDYIDNHNPKPEPEPNPENAYDPVKGLADGELGYVLCIGDVAHNASKARTKGIREALGTWTGDYDSVKEGSIRINGKNIRVKEYASKEMKNTAGATWDTMEAADAVTNWINMYGDKLDMVVSNNDGMALSSLKVKNYPKGLPIFGHDAIFAAVEAIKAGELTGSVSQNPDAQAAATLQIIRNILDGATGKDAYELGFTKADKYGNKISAEIKYVEEDRSLLAESSIVDKYNVSDYELGAHDRGIKQLPENAKTYKVLLTIYNKSDNFLSSAYKPALKYYASLLKLELNIQEGDGFYDTSLDKLTNLEKYDAYALNMVRTDSAKAYTEKITGKNAEKPLIFFNRQPINPITGTVDNEAMNFNDKTYYVGFNAQGTGAVQGNLITNYWKRIRL